MNTRTIITLVFMAFTAIFNQAQAVVIGGQDVGWTIDFDKVTSEQKKSFGWFDNDLKTKYSGNFSNNYSSSGYEWVLEGRAFATHYTGGPALFAIVELLNNSTLEDFKKTHYLAMSVKKGFKEVSCVEIAKGAQSCEVALNNWSPSRSFYAVFYKWKTPANRTFVMVVRNAQSMPDRITPEEGAKTLIPLIMVTE